MDENTTSTGAGRPTSVYRFYDADDNLLYVGITSRHLDRAVEHSKVKRWFTKVALTRWEHYPTREQAETRELYLITTLEPRYNIAGLPDEHGRPRGYNGRDEYSEQREELVVRLYLAGWRTPDIAKTCGCSTRTVYTYLEKHNVERDGRSRW